MQGVPIRRKKMYKKVFIIYLSLIILWGRETTKIQFFNFLFYMFFTECSQMIYISLAFYASVYDKAIANLCTYSKQ